MGDHGGPGSPTLDLTRAILRRRDRVLRSAPGSVVISTVDDATVRSVGPAPETWDLFVVPTTMERPAATLAG
jgi:hypothetical protein